MIRSLKTWHLGVPLILARCVALGVQVKQIFLDFFHTPLSSQGINESTNFRLLQRLSVIFGSATTVSDLLLPAETTIHEKWLTVETVRVILLPAETLSRKQNHMDSLYSKLFIKHNSLCRKQEITDSLGGSQI